MNYDKDDHYIKLNFKQQYNLRRLSIDKFNNMNIYRPKTTAKKDVI